MQDVGANRIVDKGIQGGQRPDGRQPEDSGAVRQRTAEHLVIDSRLRFALALAFLEGIPYVLVPLRHLVEHGLARPPSRLIRRNVDVLPLRSEIGDGEVHFFRASLAVSGSAQGK